MYVFQGSSYSADCFGGILSCLISQHSSPFLFFATKNFSFLSFVLFLTGSYSGVSYEIISLNVKALKIIHTIFCV